MDTQRKHRLEDEKRAIEQTRRDEVRHRVDQKADDILNLVRLLDDSLFGNRIVLARATLWPADPEEKREARRIWRQILVASAYLTQPLRRHVEVLWILTDAEQLASAGWVQPSAWGVGRHVLGWAQVNLERYLRGEALPDGLEGPVRTYREAQDALNESFIREMEESQADGEVRNG